MSQPRRSLGPVIAYMLTLLGLVLGGIWLWNAVRQAPAPRNQPAAHAAPPQTLSPPAGGEELGAADRRQLDDILRRKSTGTRP